MSRASWTGREPAFDSSWLPGLGFGEQGKEGARRNKGKVLLSRRNDRFQNEAGETESQPRGQTALCDSDKLGRHLVGRDRNCSNVLGASWAPAYRDSKPAGLTGCLKRPEREACLQNSPLTCHMLARLSDVAECWGPIFTLRGKIQLLVGLLSRLRV